jgi:hypothetical protein
MSETIEEVVIPAEDEELPANDPPADDEEDDDEEEQRWRTLSEVKDQMDNLLTEVRTSNLRAQDQAATVSQLLATNQELTRQLTENNQLLSIRALSTDPSPNPEPADPSPPKPSDPKPSESDEKPATENEPPPVDPPAPAPAERVQRRRRSI